MRSCAFLTLEDRSGFCIYDHLLIPPLRDRGWSVEEIPWNRSAVDWSVFDAVVIRSTWDYQNDPVAFLDVLESIQAVSRLFNPLAVCRWNLDKGYLRDLETRGVSIVPTAWLDGLNTDAVEHAFARSGEERLVAKPLVGANADDTFVLDRADPTGWRAATDCFSSRRLMLQPFVRAILDEGEYSLFYFGGRFSHAILKRPAPGDFRVQEEHGGLIRPINPPADIAVTAQGAIEAIGERLLYARVDLVRLADATPVVMELELIEPSLYFDQCPDATGRFAEAFDEMWRS